jgi:hypothetical protein
MKRTSLLITAACSLVLLGGVGCHHTYYAPPPPPPAGPPPIVQMADRNGFETGRSDGARESNAGYPFAPRRTRAYHDTPGYDPAFGPFNVYRDTFRNAYLRGYDRGFYHR